MRPAFASRLQTQGEHRWMVTTAVAVAIVLQLTLPPHLALPPWWLLPVLLSGGAIWATNVIVFALWYWELDRGGPAARAHAVKTHPDLLFPQMTSPESAVSLSTVALVIARAVNILK